MQWWQRWLNLALLMAWTGAVIVLWRRSPVGALVLMVTGALALMWVLRRAGASSRPTEELTAEQAERQALYVVTQMLSNLTRIQVAYLCQRFDSPTEARSWLRRALPRSLRPATDRLQADLEAARGDDPPAALKLALRVIALRQRLEQDTAALQAAHETHPNHAVASPIAFVITEHMEQTDDEPLVVTLASLDPTQPTLLPTVDVVNVFVEDNGKRKIQGQTDFDALRRAIADHLRPLPGPDGVYVTDAFAADEPIDVPISRPPMGFVVGLTEMLRS